MLNCKAVKIVNQNQDLLYSAMLTALNELGRVQYYNEIIGNPISKIELKDLIEDLQDVMRDFSDLHSTWRQQHMGDC